jgi:SpoIID/LytB domain protein
VRALAALVLVSSLLVLVGPAHAGRGQASQDAPGEAVFLLSGRGWGHGVGMSQYGAYGMAKDGKSYAQILSYYYSGTQLGKSSTNDVRVLLEEGRRALTISSTLPYSATDANGVKTKLPAGPLVLTPRLGKSSLKLPSPTGPVIAASPVVFSAGKAPLSVDGRLYHGKLEIAVQGSFLRAVNVVQIESYLEGVVAGEMPHTWPLEALKAQAVAARSYALANRVKGKPFDLYSDQRSQVYVGISGEKPETSEAVRATAGQVVLYGGRIASTLYFSSSGGKTASSADVFGVSVPYLVSRPDPWDKYSPYHRWGPIVLGARTIQAKLDVADRVFDATGVPTPSGRLRSITLQTTAGPTSVPAALLRTSLGLRSTWVTIGVLRLDHPQQPAVYGTPFELSGLARGLQAPMLSSSQDGVAWRTIGPFTRAGNGAVETQVKPTGTARFRIEVNGAASPALLVPVSSRVRLTEAVDPGMLTGTVRPRLTGASVAVDRLKGTAWTPVAKTSVDSTGSFSAKVRLVPGSYRARVAATNGLTEGLSPTLTVSG